MGFRVRMLCNCPPPAPQLSLLQHLFSEKGCAGPLTFCREVLSQTHHIYGHESILVIPQTALDPDGQNVGKVIISILKGYEICFVKSFRNNFPLEIAARAPCDVFDPW